MKNTPSPKAPVKSHLPDPNAPTFKIVQFAISEVTGNNLEDITLDAHLEDDLGINMVTEFLPILKSIQKLTDVILPIQEVKQCATIAELVELIDEEREL